MLLYFKFLILLLMASLTFFIIGCSKEAIKTNNAESGTFTDIYTTTLSTACIQCHVPSGSVYINNGVHLDFSTQSTAYNSITSQVVSGSSSRNICPNVKIVDPRSIATSYLAGVLFSEYHIDNFDNKTGCTPYSVHLQDQNLSSSEKTSIINWINAGALNN